MMELTGDVLLRSFLPQQRILHFTTTVISARVAKSPIDQERGLMFVRSMADNHGVLFEYRYPTVLSFWMKNTCLPLSIGFVEYVKPKCGMIVDIQDMEPFSTQTHKSPKPVTAALEVNQGWFQRNRVEVGALLTW